MLRTLNLVLLDPGGPSQFGSNYYRFGPSQSKNLSSYNWDPTVGTDSRNKPEIYIRSGIRLKECSDQ